MNGVQDISAETIELTKQLFSNTGQGIEKAITTSLGLQGYNLEGPSKKVFPVLSPLRNRIARTRAPIGLDDAVQDEAVWLGRAFEDVRAFSALSVLQARMIEEEKVILGGVATALGTAPLATLGAMTACWAWSRR